MKLIKEGQKFIIKNATAKIYLHVLTAAIVRVFDQESSTGSYAIEENKEVKTAIEVENFEQKVILKTDLLKIIIDKTLHIDIYNWQDQPLILDYRGNRRPLDRGIDPQHLALAKQEGHELAENSTKQKVLVIKQLSSDEHFYGLGDKTGFLDKRGYEYDNWNSDNPEPHVESFKALYKSIPFLLGLKKGHPYGIFFDNTYKSHFDLGKESNDYYYYSAAAGEQNYYVIGGKSLKDIVTNYTYLTGKTPLPQKWTLGYQQSRWGYSISQQEVEKIAKKLRANDLPCDVIHFDIDYMDGYRVFTWRKDTYDDPQKFIKSLADQGFRVMPIIDPGVKVDDQYKIYQEGIKNGYFAKNNDGTVYVNKVWPGDAVYPDFAREDVQKWWANNIKYLVDLGTCGVWNDMNEPASFNGPLPGDVIFSDKNKPSTHAKIHNVYGHNMARATYNGLKKYSGKRPFVITRAAYAGTQKYSTVWTGDNQSLWPHLQMMIPQLCNLGMSGFAFAGTDIGGFGADCTSELLVRWIEAAMFSPLFRNHAAVGTRAQEAWSFDDETLRIYRKYLKLRYHLISYLYDLFYQEEKDGLPIMRPLVLNYPQDRATYRLNDEFMAGNFLVAPIVNEGQTKRAVYLPQGEWIDFWTGVEYSGAETILVNGPLAKLPLFVKKNSIISWDVSHDHIDTNSHDVITFRLFGDSGEYCHYQDNGLDFNYQNGEYNLYQIKIGQTSSIKLQHHGYEKIYDKIILKTEDKETIYGFNKNTQEYELI